MDKVRLLKQEALRHLVDSIEENLPRYRDGDFEGLLDYFDIGVHYELDVFSELQPPDEGDLKEVENCLLLANGCMEITPYLARDNRLWVYLTHAHALRYTRERWPIPEDDAKAVVHVRSHFFAQDKRSLEARNAVSRLYWLFFIASRVEHMSLDESLRVLLDKTDVRASFIERPTTLMAQKVSVAVIDQLMDSYEKDQALFLRENFREFVKKLNLYCGSNMVECLPDDAVHKVVADIATDVVA